MAHALQLLGSLLRFTHAPEQFWVLPGQLEVHLLIEQTSFCKQALAQPPQLAGSESVLTQVSPHLAKPTLHVEPHCLLAHVATPLAGALHTCPQLPQFVGLWLMSMHAAPHFAKPSPHAKSHLEALHNALPCSGLAQAAPQAPQLPADAVRSRQAPEQSLRAPSQLALQAPPEQTSPGAQTVPQAPQLLGSLEVSWH
jgi:hypothetical protein